MINRWIPWKFLIKRAARAYGIIDPLTFLARIRQFSQPSEVQEPIELVRAGIAFHTRGLINTKAIQHNLDWVWPFWVEKQFDPNDKSFIPRAFSFSHVNLTHRNWTAVGHPDIPLYPVVDPRGLVTPLYDGWSIDFWIIDDKGEMLLPSQSDEVTQNWILRPNLSVRTLCIKGPMTLESNVYLDICDRKPVLKIDIAGSCRNGGSLVAALRPYNPEGIQFIETVETVKDGWKVNGSTFVNFSRPPDKTVYSTYRDGDVVHKLNEVSSGDRTECKVGMATAAAVFSLPEETGTCSVQATVPLTGNFLTLIQPKSPLPAPVEKSWEKVMSQAAVLKVPDRNIQFLYDAALRTLVLLSADDIVPGPYTYRRFWFRDACLMLNALLGAGLSRRAFRILDTFPSRQKFSGYFQSQQGEWDSNGQVLWIMDRYQQMTGHEPDSRWMRAIKKGAGWIIRKRLSSEPASPHAGLLPPGFSAEHLGPNDYYYWDDFWGLAGLKSAARLCGLFGSSAQQETFEQNAVDFENSIFSSISSIETSRSRGGIPASCYRRMDAGAIGSMAADYPLQITPPGDHRITATLDFLIKNCFYDNAFFQDMIHSGLNIYLTLAVAQTMLRTGDTRYRILLHTVAGLATETGQWPEAIHPRTRGGCMGDGQHGWAAAEWVMMIRNLFVREEGNTLVFGSGILPEWLEEGKSVEFGPALTSFGPITVSIDKIRQKTILTVKSDYARAASFPESLVVDVPGYRKITASSIDRAHFDLEKVNI